MRLAYITSMKKGLPSFVYREIEAFIKKGLKVTIFATKFAEGVYMVPEGGDLYKLNFY